MRLYLHLALLGLLIGGLLGPWRAAQAQPAGAAVITEPLPGATVSGVVAILGTAADPQFQRYELAFSYDPDPTGTWFSLQDPVTVPMPAGLLSRWDTTNITDGLYVLRLRVYTSNRLYTETLVRGVRVQNSAPTSQPPLSPTATIPGPPTGPDLIAAQTPPTATAPLIALPPAPTARPTPDSAGGFEQGRPAEPGPSTQALRAAFNAGVQLTVIAFVLLGAYLALRAAAQAIGQRLRRR